MVTMAQARALDARTPAVMLVLTLDYCSNEYGQAPCTAAGGDCRFTWRTCEDTANFTQSTRQYKFTNRGGAYVSGAMPLLRSLSEQSPTEIYPDRFQTARAEMVFELDDDDALPYSDPTKTTGIADSGRFWRNLLARNPNFVYRKVELYEGFAEVDSASWELAWAGFIRDIDLTRFGARIDCVDRLWFAAEAEVPRPVSDTNTVQDNPLTSGAATVTVVDKDEFPDATANEPQTIKIENEYILYTGKGADPAQTLTGCTRGAFGTTAAQHAQGTAISNAVVYKNDDGGTWAACTGVEADVILLDLLCNRAEIDADYIATVDSGATANEAIDDSETEIDVNDSYYLPDSGVMKIDDEFIYFGARSSTQVTSCKRGMYGTTAAAHDDDSIIYLPTITDQMMKWRPATTWGSRYDSGTPVEDIITDLSRSAGFDVWQNEDGLIDCAIQAPLMAGETAPSLTHEDMLPDSRTYSRNEESRVTAIIVRYNPDAADAGESAENYPGAYVYAGAEEEAAVSYGRRKPREIFAPFCLAAADAQWLGQRQMHRYKNGCPLIEFMVETKDADVKTGDKVFVAIPERVDPDAAVVTRLYSTTSRTRIGLSNLRLKVADTGFADEKYGMIGPEDGLLDANIDDSQTTLDVDLAATDLEMSDIRSAGDLVIGSEEIAFTSVADQGGDVVRLGGLTRGSNGTAAAAHTAGDVVCLLYSGMADEFRLKYVCIADTDNEIASGVDGFRIV